jgi:hypothetical protein
MIASCIHPLTHSHSHSHPPSPHSSPFPHLSLFFNPQPIHLLIQIRVQSPQIIIRFGLSFQTPYRDLPRPIHSLSGTVTLCRASFPPPSLHSLFRSLIFLSFLQSFHHAGSLIAPNPAILCSLPPNIRTNLYLPISSIPWHISNI